MPKPSNQAHVVSNFAEARALQPLPQTKGSWGQRDHEPLPPLLLQLLARRSRSTFLMLIPVLCPRASCHYLNKKEKNLQKTVLRQGAAGSRPAPSLMHPSLFSSLNKINSRLKHFPRTLLFWWYSVFSMKSCSTGGFSPCHL